MTHLSLSGRPLTSSSVGITFSPTCYNVGANAMTFGVSQRWHLTTFDLLLRFSNLSKPVITWRSLSSDLSPMEKLSSLSMSVPTAQLSGNLIDLGGVFLWVLVLKDTTKMSQWLQIMSLRGSLFYKFFFWDLLFLYFEIEHPLSSPPSSLHFPPSFLLKK